LSLSLFRFSVSLFGFSTVESANATETSLNSSIESNGDLGTAVGNISLSDEDLDTERCIYCDGFLRVKRLTSHPQYCSKKCRGRSADSSFQQSENRSPASANITSTSAVLPVPDATVYASPVRSAPVSPDAQQRPQRTLIIKMGSVTSPESPHASTLCQTTEDVTSAEARHAALHKPAPRVYLPSAPAFVVRAPQVSETQVTPPHAAGPSVHGPSTYAASVLDHTVPRNFDAREGNVLPDGHPRTWTCDEVATWVTRVTGTDAIGEKFRNQDVDGQSLLLMAESEGGIAALLTQKLLLKLGPVLKLEKALKDLIARNND
uniref:SAM domain-containing protein n=1 Tax=Enterobius vermicularis TaxID=51028 RepID=A0A0N4VCW7_ENTVE